MMATNSSGQKENAIRLKRNKYLTLANITSLEADFTKFATLMIIPFELLPAYLTGEGVDIALAVHKTLPTMQSALIPLFLTKHSTIKF